MRKSLRVSRMQRTVGLCAAFFFLFCEDAFAQNTKPVYRIAAVEWAGWSPLQVAEHEGFWAGQGLDVEIIVYDDPIVVLEAVRAGRCQFAMDMAGSLVGQYLRGRDVVILAETDWSHGGDKIIVKKGHDLIEYKGQPLGVFLKQPSCYYLLHQYLAPKGLSLSDFRLIELSPDDLAAQFIAGRMNVILDYDPHGVKAVTAGDGEVVATSATYEGSVPECMWMYRPNLEKIPEDDIKGILRGWILAANWVNAPSNWGAYCEILNRCVFQGQGPFSEQELREMVQSVRIHTSSTLPDRNKTGGGLYQYLDALRTMLGNEGMLTREYAPEEIFENRFIMNVLNDEAFMNGLSKGLDRK